VQLHGDERPEYLSRLPRKVSIVRAYRCGAQGLAPLRVYLDECRSLGRTPDAVLIDADAQGEFGGTGRVADWNRIAEERDLVGGVRLILSGGLTPANVAESIAAVQPDGVDVASGVESAPGRKDAALIQQFVAAARYAFAISR
jgi:phosphoribosylanthranilate isomerase